MGNYGHWSRYFWYCYVDSYEQLSLRLEEGLCVGHSSLVCGRGVGFHLRCQSTEAPYPRFLEVENGLASDNGRYEVGDQEMT